MSEGQREIVCRRCDELFAMESGNCPHCGQSVRSDRGPAIVIALGAVLAIASMLSIGELWFFGLVGVLMIVGGAYVIREKRERIREASERSDTAPEETAGDAEFSIE